MIWRIIKKIWNPPPRPVITDAERQMRQAKQQKAFLEASQEAERLAQELERESDRLAQLLQDLRRGNGAAR